MARLVGLQGYTRVHPLDNKLGSFDPFSGDHQAPQGWKGAGGPGVGTPPGPPYLKAPAPMDEEGGRDKGDNSKVGLWLPKSGV